MLKENKATGWLASDCKNAAKMHLYLLCNIDSIIKDCLSKNSISALKHNTKIYSICF